MDTAFIYGIREPLLLKVSPENVAFQKLTGRTMSLREENFVVIDVGSHVTKAGMGVSDTNKPPNVIINMADFDYPIKNNMIVSWENLEACWHTILFKELDIKKSRNEHAVLLSVPVQWTKLEHERIVQIFFENFNVPGIYIAPQPLLALYGCGSVSGIIVDIGEEVTDVNIVIDSIVQPQSSFTIPLGGQHFDDYLLQLMQQDPALVQQFEQLRSEGIVLDKEFARFVKEQQGVCHVLVGHEAQIERRTNDMGIPESAAAAAAEDIIEEEEDFGNKEEEESAKDIPEIAEVEYKGHKFSIGPYRHKVYDPLFSVELMGVDGLGLIDAMRLAASNCEPPEIRPKLWENVVLCGGGSLMTGLQLRIKAEVSRVLPCSENIGDAQPKLVGFLRIPDYFTVLKEKQYQKYSTWLGGEIVAKLVFIDAKNYVSKVDYNEHGPSVVHTKSY